MASTPRALPCGAAAAGSPTPTAAAAISTLASMTSSAKKNINNSSTITITATSASFSGGTMREKDEATRDFVKLVYELGPYVSYKCLFLADIKENKVRSEGYLMKIQHFGYLYFVAAKSADADPNTSSSSSSNTCSYHRSHNQKRRPRSRTVLDWVTVRVPRAAHIEPELEEAAIRHLRTEGATLVHIASTGNTLHVKFKFDKAADRWLSRRSMLVNGTTFTVAPCREQELVKQVEDKIQHAEKNISPSATSPPINNINSKKNNKSANISSSLALSTTTKFNFA